jgi:hypothetical protein
MVGKKPQEPPRRNRAIGAGEAVMPALDAALKKRGFATRDLITSWRAMAPAPYDQVAVPDKLVWPRGERGAEGATLYLRCVPAHALALSHEGSLIAAAVNRYFGYLLVTSVRLAAMPLIKDAPAKPPPALPDNPTAVSEAVAGVEDEGLKAALAKLGAGVFRGSRSAG